MPITSIFPESSKMVEELSMAVDRIEFSLWETTSVEEYLVSTVGLKISTRCLWLFQPAEAGESTLPFYLNDYLKHRSNDDFDPASFATII